MQTPVLTAIPPTPPSTPHDALERAVRLPPHHDHILRRAHELAFTMNSDALTGALLRSLAATKPTGRLLELGTGCGLGTSWLVDGLGIDATLISVDTDARTQDVARSVFGADPRLRFVLQDGGVFLSECHDSFDLIYADAWPGKFEHLDLALTRLAPGGAYVVDDLLPQPNWPDGHAPNVIALVDRLGALPGYQWTPFLWSTGVGLLVKVMV